MFAMHFVFIFRAHLILVLFNQYVSNRDYDIKFSNFRMDSFHPKSA